MNKKLIFIAGILLVLPLVSLANEPEATATTSLQDNATTSAIELVRKDPKKEELRKQLVDTINVYSAIVDSLQRLSERVTERKDILVTQNSLSGETKTKIETKIESLNKKLNDTNEKITNDLTNYALVLIDSDKPAKPLRDFKKEANKIKTNIISAHKLVLEIINVVKTESLLETPATDQDN